MAQINLQVPGYAGGMRKPARNDWGKAQGLWVGCGTTERGDSLPREEEMCSAEELKVQEFGAGFTSPVRKMPAQGAPKPRPEPETRIQQELQVWVEKECVLWAPQCSQEHAVILGLSSAGPGVGFDDPGGSLPAWNIL